MRRPTELLRNCSQRLGLTLIRVNYRPIVTVLISSGSAFLYYGIDTERFDVLLRHSTGSHAK